MSVPEGCEMRLETRGSQLRLQIHLKLQINVWLLFVSRWKLYRGMKMVSLFPCYPVTYHQCPWKKNAPIKKSRRLHFSLICASLKKSHLLIISEKNESFPARNVRISVVKDAQACLNLGKILTGCCKLSIYSF